MFKSLGFKNLYIAFAILFLVTFLGAVVGWKTANSSQEIIEDVTHELNPYLTELDELYLLFTHSKMHATNWVFLQHSVLDKEYLKKIHSERYPKLKKSVQIAHQKVDSRYFNLQKDLDSLHLIFSKFEQLMEKEKEIMQTLNSFDDYQNASKLLVAEGLLEEEILPESDELIQSVDRLMMLNKNRAEQISQDMKASLNQMIWVAPLSSLLIFLVLILAIFYIYRHVTTPILAVQKNLLDLSQGKIVAKKPIRSLEKVIREMTSALHELNKSFRLTSNFATAIGEGNLSAHFQPLSQEDQLGNALIEMQKSLKAYSEEMEEKVALRTEELQASEEELKQAAEELMITNENLNEKNFEINRQHNKIKDSIQYAKRIQNAILPLQKEISEFLKDYFILFFPKDIVSGDFYWFKAIPDNKVIISAIDCTGHGVPGALMSMIGDALLSQIVQEKQIYQADLILNMLHLGIRQALKQEQTETRDGMDMALCVIDSQAKNLQYAGAMNPLFYVQNNELKIIKGDKFPIGGDQKEHERIFTPHLISFAEQPLTLYLSTDGYQDQFGGKEDRKFMVRRLRELLFEIASKPIKEQYQILVDTFVVWKGNKPQIDDVLIIGIYLA